MGILHHNHHRQSPRHASITDNLLNELRTVVSDQAWVRADPRNQYASLLFDNETFFRYSSADSREESTASKLPSSLINVTSDVLQDTAQNLTCGQLDTCQRLANESLEVYDQGYEFENRNWWFLFLIILVIAGGLGNVLVCLAICLERRLQNVTNYFLLSLAVADLLVCVAVMPFGIVDGFLGYWPFDWHICNVWVSCDVLSCSASIIHMCFISLGRYMGIRNPLKTRSSSKKVVMMKIVLVWLVAMGITSPITVLAMVDATNIEPAQGICAINNRFFFVFGSMFAFYVPMVVMVVSYVLTVRLLRQKAKFLAEKPSRRVPFIRRVRRPSPTSPESSAKNGHIQTSTYCSRCQLEVDNGSREVKSILKEPRERHNNRHRVDRHQQHQHSFQQHHQQLVPGMVRTLGTNQVMNEQKATKVLGIVFFSFVVCWTPFFLLNILFAVRKTEDFPSYLATTFLWLGYVSSTINPIIYTVFNKTFKRAFWKLLTCQCQYMRNVSLHSSNDMSTWAFRSANNYRTKSGLSPELYQESMC